MYRTIGTAVAVVIDFFVEQIPRAGWSNPG